jgi:hypothetical protein
MHLDAYHDWLRPFLCQLALCTSGVFSRRGELILRSRLRVGDAVNSAQQKIDDYRFICSNDAFVPGVGRLAL